MGMVQQVLPPGMQDGKEAEAGAQVFWVAGNGEQCFRRRFEQDVVDRFFVMESDPGDLFGHGENDVEVFDRQQLFLPVFEPFGPIAALALRAMTVPAGVVSVASSVAAVAFFEMAAEDCGTAGFDGPHDAQLRKGKRVSFPVSSAVLSKNVGHFESGPWHPGYFRGFCFGLLPGLSSGLSSGLTVAATTCEDTLT